MSAGMPWGASSSMTMTSFSPRRRGPGSQNHPVSYLIGGVMGVLVAILAGASGAPGFFVAFALIAGLFSFVMYFPAQKSLEDEKARERLEYEERQKQLRTEVATTVKETLRSSIKVRCRYCGMLNGEEDERCESCGAPL